MDPIVIGIATVVVNILVLSVGGTWKISELKASLVKAISDSKDLVEQKQDKHEQYIGETISAIREKIREVELYVRDTYMRRDSFYELNKANAEALTSLGSEIKARLERMEAKIDQKT
jgi:hypothetical protein